MDEYIHQLNASRWHYSPGERSIINVYVLLSVTGACLTWGWMWASFCSVMTMHSLKQEKRSCTTKLVYLLNNWDIIYENGLIVGKIRKFD